MNVRRTVRPFIFLFCSLILLSLLLPACERFATAEKDPVDGWAVLAEKDDYKDVGMTDMLVDYVDIAVMRQALEKAGWNPEQIHDLREFDRESLQAELDWLETSADENDIALLYVTGHAGYLVDEQWWQFFDSEWEQIPSDRRLLILDVCRAEKFANAVLEDPRPHLSIAAVDGNELGWKGIEEEELPIIGGVFTHYFSDALHDPAADADGSGMVSVQEAAQTAEVQARTYMHDVVFAVPEFVEMFNEAGYYPEQDPEYPDVIIDDAIGEPLYLALDSYR